MLDKQDLCNTISDLIFARDELYVQHFACNPLSNKILINFDVLCPDRENKFVEG
jgi:hypothetical protein